MNSVPLSGADICPGFAPACYQIDPIRDRRWTELVQRHPKASIFHTVKWLQVLRQTYGYEPVAFTTSPSPEELKNGLLFCRIHSRLTGRRLVSLPFSDHCEPLCDSSEDLNLLLHYLQGNLGQNKRLEIRPVSRDLSKAGEGIEFRPSRAYQFHVLDLHPGLDEVFRSLNKDSVQRRITRAERAGLVEKCGRSEELLKAFYAMFVKTRGRHSLPPIPMQWFRNLLELLGDAAEIRLASKDEIPVAAILTLQFRDIAYYKYGCSDARFNKFGATPWLLWKAIAAAKLRGANEFDLGRTEDDGGGLLAFKNHWVQPRPLIYWQFPFNSSPASGDFWRMKLAKQVFSLMPNKMLTIIGNLMYRHIG